LHVVVLGNGITGVTAARELRKRQPDWRITIVSGESRYHYSRPALMYVFMGHMRYQDTKPYPDSLWAEERLELLQAWVCEVDVDQKCLKLRDGESLAYDKLLIATGSKPNKFGWPGQDLAGVQGLWGLQDLKLLYENSQSARHAVIVGGGLIGIEMAEMLHSRRIHVSFLVRESSYWDNVLPPEESAMINRHIRALGFELQLETELKEIEDDGSGRACAVHTSKGERMPASVVGLTAGVSPNVDLVRGSAIECGRGVLVDWSMRTSAPDVFAAGDCAELVTEGDARNVIQQVWYTGKLQGRLAAAVMAGEEARYDPGIWYNSAKFLDLEYQTYGRVNMRVEGESNVYWEHPDGQHCARLVHLNGTIIGFNTMGMRWRHEVCERWLAEERPVDWVVDHLEEIHFDPEFFRRHEAEIRRSMKEQLS